MTAAPTTDQFPTETSGLPACVDPELAEVSDADEGEVSAADESEPWVAPVKRAPPATRIAGMGLAMKQGRRTWLFLGVGAVIGLALGILVSITTDVPLAPEVGIVVGLLIGWLLRRVSA
jgi:hypothetical protein